MQKPSFRRKILLLLLLLILAVPWASAAGRLTDAHPVEVAVSPLGIFGRFWTFLQSAWSETGSRLDPNGSAAPQSGTGTQIDPNGSAAPKGDEGSQIDPDG